MIRVLGFLGWDSKPADAEAWLRSARKQRPDVDFSAWSYPEGAGSSEQEALNGFGNAQFDKVIASIRENAGDDHILWGHSSGAAIANAIIRGMGDPPVPDRVRLVALDGFPPGDDIYALHPDTECWSAKCGSARSRNWGPCSERPNFRVYEAKNCYTEWALHGSLVNSAASDETVKDVPHIYNGCVANLCWLQPEMAANWIA